MKPHPIVASALLWLGLYAALGQNVRAASMPAPLDLSGTWRFSLDQSDSGVSESWFSRDLKDTIHLPGILQSQGFGNEISTNTPWVLSLYDKNWSLRADYQAYTQPGNVKVPFLSQPQKHYLGAAWYQHDIEIPQEWENHRIVLTLERPHWETTVWVDDKKIGSYNSLVAPHIYDLGTLAPGKHRLSIRVDNRMIIPGYRPDAHSVSDSLGGSWNGITGKIELAATSRVWIDSAQVFPNVEKKSALIKVRIGNQTGQPGAGTLSAGSVSQPVQWDASGGKAEIEVPLGAGAQTWDEFNPALQHLTVKLAGAGADDEPKLTFGLREIHTQGADFLLNSRQINLRGTHNGGDFPLTGSPPSDVDSWKRIFRTCQEWGLNMMRFHSFCPPEAAFQAADELGFYLQPECGMWNDISPGTAMEKILYEETTRMMEAYGNHPSYLLLSPSNEPKGRWQASLPKWVNAFRQQDPRRLYTTGTGWSLIDVPGPVEGADYLAVAHIGSRYMVRGNSAWFGRDYSASVTGVTVPVLSHELGQWCAYPDFDVIKKFTGYLQPGNYEIFRDSLAAHGLLERDKDFAWASGRFQLACYKEEIEANLRTVGLGGFELLDLHDYIGQGTALVGLLDTFWEPKGYATPAEFRKFCSATVPLARLRTRLFTTTDAFNVDVEIAHFADKPIDNAQPVWKIVDVTGATVASGEWPARTIPLGKGTALGSVSADLSKLAAPGAYKLVVSLRGTKVQNDWNFWLYPASAAAPAPSDVLITHSWDEATAKLSAGGKVLLLPRTADLDWTSPPLAAVPIFWNRLMGPGWSRMLGLWCDAKHPALAEFPTDASGDWQWIDLVRNTRAINLDHLPRALQPIVQPVDDWNRNYKLGLVFECRVGPGKLMVCSADLESSLETRPVARQLRRSLLDYMGGKKFQPTVAVSPTELNSLHFDSRIMHQLGATASGPGANNLIDGDPNTFWQAGSARGGGGHPYEFTIAFPAPTALSGFIAVPRQNDRNHEGDIRAYTLQASDDGTQWREVSRGELASTFEPQTVRFSEAITARQLKFTALTGFATDQTAALAEFAILYAGPQLADADAPLQYKRVRTSTTEIDEPPDAPAQPPAKR